MNKKGHLCCMTARNVKSKQYVTAGHGSCYALDQTLSRINHSQHETTA